MKTKILGLLAVGLLAGPAAASAAILTYDFTATATSGPLTGQTSSGYFKFDSSIIPSAGGRVDQLNLLSELRFSWNAINYTEATANTGFLEFLADGSLAYFCFGNNTDAGACYNTGGTDNWFVLVSVLGTGELRQRINYSTVGAESGLGDVSFALRSSNVPEPGTLALLGLGLAGLGLSRRRRAN